MAKECDQPRNPDTVVCRNCEKTGHFSRECPEPKDWSKHKCSNCGELGHGPKVSNLHILRILHANLISVARLRLLRPVEMLAVIPAVAGVEIRVTPPLLVVVRLPGILVVTEVGRPTSEPMVFQNTFSMESSSGCEMMTEMCTNEMFGVQYGHS
jgi:hypothetical protein